MTTKNRNPFGWCEIYVQDMARAKKFYETVLAITFEKLAAPEVGDEPGLEMWAFSADMDAPGCGGTLVKMKDTKSGGNSVLPYFSCDDCGVEAARVVKAGGKIEREKMSIGHYGFTALALDTEGNTFGLHSLK